MFPAGTGSDPCCVSVALRILSWNILHGGGARCALILEEIEKVNADIVTLQEFRRGKHGAVILQGLQDQGFVHIFVPDTDSATQNTLLIASRFPVSCKSFPDDTRPVRGLIAQISLDSALLLNMLALHLPQKREQLPYFVSMLELPTSWLSGYSLIIGDLNCGIPFEDSQTKTFYASHMFQRLLYKGWIDSWRQRHPDVRDYTWVSSTKGNGFRYDHALTSTLLNGLVKHIAYNHGVRERKISDHSSLLLEIKTGS